MFRHALTASVLLAAFLAQAKTPGEVYEQAAKSTVVVRNIDSEGKPKSMGSGVILPDRDVVTNCHVVNGASQIKVRIGDKEYPAALRYSDWDRDVCSLSVAGLNAPAVVVGSTKGLKVGAKVYAIGAPKGLELTLSDGIVSSLREVEGGQYIQTTAAISPGSSGGGLFDENGALVGLTTFYLAEGQNLNFAVPVEWVKELPKRSTKNVPLLGMQWPNKAMDLEARKNWAALIEHCRHWTQEQPDRAWAWNFLGVAYENVGQATKSIESYQRAVHIDPEYALAWYNMGLMYNKVGQSSKAIEAFRNSLRISPDDQDAWNDLGLTYLAAKKNAKAIEAFQQTLRIKPDHVHAWYNIGLVYFRSAQPAKAIENYQQALRIDPEYVDAWVNLGQTYSLAKQYTKAVDSYQQAIRINPNSAEAWRGLGLVQLMDKQTNKGIETLRQAVRINPKSADSWEVLGLAYSIDGQRSKVMEVYKQLKALDGVIAERFFNEIVLP